MKATEQYLHVVVFIKLNKVVLTFKSVGETQVCDHSNESYWTVLSCGTFIMLFNLVVTFQYVYSHGKAGHKSY